MVIVVEDGTGIVIANSYLTVEEADDILSVNIHSTWAMLDEITKANLLMWASRVIDERVRWNGKKLHATSGLGWPRYGVRDKEGNLIDDDTVPRAVKVATATLAQHLITGNPEVANSNQNLTELSVDVITLKFDSKLVPDKYPTQIKFILAGLGTVSMGRGGPKRIVKH